MRNVYTIARRELSVYLLSPMAYVISTVFLAVMGGLAGFILYYSREATMRYVFMHAVSLLFLVLVSQLLTMRLLADEQRLGTLELLLTAPIRDWEVVVGKYLAAVCVWLIMVLLTGYFPVVLIRIGNPDVGAMLSGYLGYFLLGSALMAIGVFASSLTQNQIVASMVGLGISLMLWLSGALAEIVGDTVREVVAYLPIFDHYFDFVRGVIDTKDIIYYLSLIALFLFLTTRVVESKRWK